MPWHSLPHLKAAGAIGNGTHQSIYTRVAVSDFFWADNISRSFIFFTEGGELVTANQGTSDWPTSNNSTRCTVEVNPPNPLTTLLTLETRGGGCGLLSSSKKRGGEGRDKAQVDYGFEDGRRQ